MATASLPGASERIYTKTWHKWFLRQGEANRSESDPRMAVGDALPVMILWMDKWVLCRRLAVAAEEQGDLGMRSSCGECRPNTVILRMAARMRVDAVTLDQISKPVAEMYTQSTRMELEVFTVLPSGIRTLKEFNNRVTVTARTKAAANKAVNIPASQVNVDSAPTGKTWKRGTGKERRTSQRMTSPTEAPHRGSPTPATAQGGRSNAAGDK
jgi:hypothetical protein